LKKTNVERNKKALSSKSVSHSQFEQSQMEYENQFAKVQDIKNSIKLIPSTRKAFKANIEVNNAQLEDAKLNLERTFVIAPFMRNCVCYEVGDTIKLPKKNDFVHVKPLE